MGAEGQEDGGEEEDVEDGGEEEERKAEGWEEERAITAVTGMLVVPMIQMPMKGVTLTCRCP